MISEGEGQIKITPWLLIWVPALCGFYYLKMLMVRNEESCGQYTECEMLMGMLLVWETQQESQYARDWSQTGALDSAFTGMPVVNKVNKESHHLERREIRRGFPSGASGREPACQCRRCKRHGFNPWVGKIPWKRAQQSTPVFLPGEFHGQRNLVGYSPWGRKESDMIEVT